MIYFNDVHILWYVLIGIIGLIVGQIVHIINDKLPKGEKIIEKNIINQLKQKKKLNYLLMIITAIIYIALLYKFGIQKNIMDNITLIKYLVLTPMILSAFIIDYRLQIIPNRLNLTIFETGLIFTFLLGIVNINLAINMILGMLAGAGIFLIITLVGGLIAGKEAMGFGDVKFMGALGLYFGLYGIIAIALIAFLIGAIISIILLISKIKKTDEYIPFGPFIVIASFILMFIPFDLIVLALLKIFTLGMYVQ